MVFPEIKLRGRKFIYHKYFQSIIQNTTKQKEQKTEWNRVSINKYQSTMDSSINMTVMITYSDLSNCIYRLKEEDKKSWYQMDRLSINI